MEKIKIGFMGTPEFAVPVLESLIDKYEVIFVVTQPDKLVGRKQELKYSPIKEVAIKNNIKIFQPINIRNEYQEIIDMNADLIVTCAFGQIVPVALLEAPKYGCINVHASLLPKLRGGAPIHRSIIEGEKKTGVTIMYMAEKMDSGDIISQEEIAILDEDNVGTLHDKLSIMGAKLLMETISSIIDGTNNRIVQDESEVTYGYNIKREDEHLDFSKMGIEIVNHVRGLNPWPTANILLFDEEIKVLECYFEEKIINDENSIIVDIKKDALGISCSDGTVYVTKIKPFGKKIMDVKDYLNGIDKEKLLGQRVK